MIIAAHYIRRSRAPGRFCETCEKKLPAGSSMVRLYGSSSSGVQPYVIFLCQPCAEAAAGHKVNLKIHVALQRGGDA